MPVTQLCMLLDKLASKLIKELCFAEFGYSAAINDDLEMTS
jgi:hypothetical protein